jgi:hypothetical protein
LFRFFVVIVLLQGLPIDNDFGIAKSADHYSSDESKAWQTSASLLDLSHV